MMLHAEYVALAAAMSMPPGGLAVPVGCAQLADMQLHAVKIAELRACLRCAQMMEVDAPAFCAPRSDALPGDDICPELGIMIRRLQAALQVHKRVVDRLQEEKSRDEGPRDEIHMLLADAFVSTCGADAHLASAVSEHVVQDPQTRIESIRRLLEDLGTVGGNSRMHGLLFRGTRQLRAGSFSPTYEGAVSPRSRPRSRAGGFSPVTYK